MTVYTVIAGSYIAFMLAFGAWDWWQTNKPDKPRRIEPRKDPRLERARARFLAGEITTDEFERKVGKALKKMK